MELGNLEEAILLLVLALDGKAYGISVAEAYEEHFKRSIHIPSVHTVLRRLEKKKLIQSQEGGATKERGGRRKRYYTINAEGYALLVKVREQRNKVWNIAPNLSFDNS